MRGWSIGLADARERQTPAAHRSFPQRSTSATDPSTSVPETARSALNRPGCAAAESFTIRW